MSQSLEGASEGQRREEINVRLNEAPHVKARLKPVVTKDGVIRLLALFIAICVFAMSAAHILAVWREDPWRLIHALRFVEI